MVSDGDVDACRRKSAIVPTRLTPKISSSCATTAKAGARSAKAFKIVDVFILSGVYFIIWKEDKRVVMGIMCMQGWQLEAMALFDGS
jgi:hypothetical protein